MKKIILLTMCIISPLACAKFVNPVKFDGSEAQKKEAIQFIKDRVKKVYCEGPVDMCQPATLRMMEQQNLSAFKEAVQATDKKIMQQVVDTYCKGALDMCDYTTINMMYKQNLQASKKDLEW